jgi:hypothetical protein
LILILETAFMGKGWESDIAPNVFPSCASHYGYVDGHTPVYLPSWRRVTAMFHVQNVHVSANIYKRANFAAS